MFVSYHFFGQFSSHVADFYASHRATLLCCGQKLDPCTAAVCEREKGRGSSRLTCQRTAHTYTHTHNRHTQTVTLIFILEKSHFAFAFHLVSFSFLSSAPPPPPLTSLFDLLEFSQNLLCSVLCRALLCCGSTFLSCVAVQFSKRVSSSCYLIGIFLLLRKMCHALSFMFALPFLAFRQTAARAGAGQQTGRAGGSGRKALRPAAVAQLALISMLHAGNFL